MTTQTADTVALETGAGQLALTIVPFGAVIDTGRSRPSFHLRFGASVGSRAVNTPATRPDQVQLMNPGACSEVPVKSKSSSSPRLVRVSRKS